MELRNNVQMLLEQKRTSLKTMVNLGSDFYVQAKVPDTSSIYVNIGLGFHAQMTLEEAAAFCTQREAHYTAATEELTDQAARLKARIKLVVAVRSARQRERKRKGERWMRAVSSRATLVSLLHTFTGSSGVACSRRPSTSCKKVHRAAAASAARASALPSASMRLPEGRTHTRARARAHTHTQELHVHGQMKNNRIFLRVLTLVPHDTKVPELMRLPARATPLTIRAVLSRLRNF